MKKRMKRFWAILLTSAMVLNIGPMSTIVNALVDGMKALAAEDPIVVIAGSDFQNSGGDAAGGATVTGIMEQMGYSSVNGVLFGGDYSYSMSTSSNLTNLDGYLDDYCATAANRIYIQGNHDTNLSPSSSSNLLATEGGHDPEGGAYGVYAINHEDFPWSGSSSTLVKGTADLLKAYLDAKAEANYKKPIFVMSHLPLHYTNRGDNDYANLLFGVLNSYDDLNIIFLFGHNHSTAYDSYLGQGSIYLKKGDAIKVAKDGATSYNDETLNFTYMNYGYTGYIGSTNADATLTMTAFEIYEDEVVVKRYSTSGQHTLKAAGGNTQLPSGVSVNSDVYGQAAINLSNGESTISEISADSGDDSTGSGDNSGTTGGSGNVYVLDTDGVATVEDYLIVSAGADGTAQALRNNNGTVSSAEVTISNGQIVTDAEDIVWTYDENSYLTNGSHSFYLSYNNTTSFLSASEQRAVAISAIDQSAGSYSVKRDGDSYAYYLNYSESDGFTNTGSGGSAQAIYFFVRTSETGSGGGSTVTPEGGDWVTITDGSGKVVYKLDKDGIDTGVEYLIVAENAAKAMNASGETITDIDVEIIGELAYVDSEDYGWEFTSYGSSGAYYIQLNGEGYLYITYNTLEYSDSLSSNAYRNRFFITNNNDGTYVLARSKSSGTSADGYEVSWDGSKFTENSGAVRLYKYETIQSAGDAEYAKLDGELTYTVSRGASAEDALAAVKAGINVLTSASADGSNPTTLDDSNTDITWTLASYDGTVAGEYAVTISYKGVKLGTAKVIVPEVTITGYDCQTSGSVKVGATGNVRTGANITVNLEDGTSYTVPVTMNMLTKDGAAVSTEEGGEITGITVTYNGVVVCEDFTLTVREPSPYPEYPDEGAVKVDKTATGVQFQSTGVAQVELSASGIPMNQGVDVLLVLDTSSSMGFQGSLDSGTRIGVLKNCVDALIQSLKAERADGSVPDVDIAIVDFAGYLLGHDGTKKYNYIGEQVKSTDAEDVGAVLTGGWVNVQNLDDNWGTQSGKITQKSGTNYDHGLEQAYNLLAEKKAQDNGARKQFVLFMSDGAPLQYNGVNSNSLESDWEDWILGNYTQEEVEAINTIQKPEFYYGNNNGNGQLHWVAEAIKGSPDNKYPIVYHENYTYGEATMAMKDVYGLGATMYSVGLALEATNMPTDVAGQEAVLKTIASSEDVFYSVTSATGLQEAFDDFAGEVLMAATNARFVDQLGDSFNLQMGTIKDLNGNVVEGVENKIEIISYDVYTRADYLAGKCTADKIGVRKGTSIILETITFNADGSEAYSDQIYTEDDNGNKTYTNILIGGVICAKYFWYNTKPNDVTIDGVDIPTGIGVDGLTTGSSNILPSETFYWKLGTIKTTELALRYYVYLDGSMQGTTEAGSYATNNFAILYYNNYLNQPTGQPCQKVTMSPTVAWKAANVSYAFYLVDENGNIIVNQTTGETGSFANKIAVTNPVLYKEILLNNVDNVESIEVASLGVLPKGYDLYDKGAQYTIQIKSDATGSWTITKSATVASTYVTQYDLSNAAAYTNELTKNSNADFTHTIVWFAVVWKVQALPDTVVIDYGLPVDISVLGNDMFGEKGKLAGVGAYSGSLNLNGFDTTLASGFGNSYTGTYGIATADTTTGKIRYTLNTSNGMQMQTYEKFAYAVNYTGSENAGYYYDTITVIPATTIYYEDEFLTYGYTGTGPNGEKSWVEEGSPVEGVTQDEDRPGKYSLTDANNIYGYDKINLPISEYSMGIAMKASVGSDSYATAEFVFCGTGFDIVSMTSSDTGVLVVQVYDTNGTVNTSDDILKTSKFVNTYYGVSWNGTEWVSVANGVENTPNKIYQVPVIQVNDLEYGQYRAVLTASYYKNFDENYSAETTNNSYDLYIDAVRIYDPANDGAKDEDTVIEDAYKADGESWPVYLELRDLLIDQETFGNAETGTKITGAIFIDGMADVGDAQMRDYISYGPNNEVYLAPGDRIAFLLDLNQYVNAEGKSIVESVHIGIRSADGTPGSYTFSNIVKEERVEGDKKVTAGTYYNPKTSTISTTTDMYYDLTDWKKDIIVISNYTTDTGTSGCIAITNIKITFNENPNGVSTTSMDEIMYMTPAFATMTLRSLNNVVGEDILETEEVTTETPNTEVSETKETETEAPETKETETEVPETEETETEAPETEETETEVPETEETETEDVGSESTEHENSSTTQNILSGIVNVVKSFTNWLSKLWRR